ncbi:acetyl-CoA carboxylase family protein [Nocardia carnea]|uniref:acetyl-CoA carboxylase family protein n=1 Tax=Nocardia carnea TaxID=37328 RepID=UPI002457295D|nr:carboxyl transferase domain-containing protein [Nocardia carnea]
MSAEPGRLLVANRGEIALRVFRAAQSMGVATVGVRSQDDDGALHADRCDDLVVLPGSGPAAYLDIAAILAAAGESGATAIHPGYGFLSENAGFARACGKADITFVGSAAETLELFGDKGRARQLAVDHDVPVLPGTTGPTSPEQILDFLTAQDSPVMLKAVAGGGGRGTRVVRSAEQLPEAYEQCRAEAVSAFGVGDLYVERLLTGARHVEVQLVGDGTGAVVHLWDRDCTLQRRHQKLVEIAPSAVLTGAARERMLAAAVRLGRAVRLHGVATAEFLALPDGTFYFLEVNPRLQVEHTVTEQVTGVDIVHTQLRLAAGATLAELGLEQATIAEPAGCAIQIRVNAETVRLDGTLAPAAGTISGFDLPTGAGIRVDTAGRTGAPVNPRFDTLLAKIVVHDHDGFAAAHRLAGRALRETVITGVPTNLAVQRAILADPVFAARAADTTWVDRHLVQLAARARELEQQVSAHARRGAGPKTPAGPSGHRGANPAARGAPAVPGAGDDRAVRAPTAGVVVAVEAEPGTVVAAGTTIAVVEAMKMHHPVTAGRAGTVANISVDIGDFLAEGETVAVLDPVAGSAATGGGTETTLAPGHIRPDLAALRERRAKLYDEARPEAVAKRHRLGMRTARENIAALTDDGLLVEYGGLAVAAQRGRRDLADLEARTPADGIITGLARINGDRFATDRSTCAVLAYDYTVLAGTQGYFSHQKTDRLLQLARSSGYPVILFAEGGGGRPGDSDPPMVAGLHYPTFAAMGALSGVVPTIGIAAGRCFAGNAALLGTCDVVIATENSTIGMAGPAMIEGGGLGVYAPEEVGPIDIQRYNGVVDIVVADEAEATEVARRYLSYFQGRLPAGEVPDQRALRHLVPEDRKRVYDIRAVLDTLFDSGSVLELRRDFAPTVLTALARIDGAPVGVIANNPALLGGAIDASGADKLARFLQLCDAYGLPVVSLCDTPGFMVGPDSEQQAAVRHFPRLFVLGGHLTVPLVTVVLRKGYGLGALAMAGGGFHNTNMIVAWPTGEFGGMGVEGAVHLASRDVLAAIPDPDERARRFDELVALAYAQGSAVNTAAHLEIDDVIDPADTRAVLAAVLLSRPGPPRDGWRNSARSVGIDTW